METIRTLRNLLARLAGAPPRLARGDPDSMPHPVPRPAQRSALYAPLALVKRTTHDAHDPRDKRTTRQRDGDEGEHHARRYLECAGLTFVAANLRFRDGEIDLIMRDRPSPALRTPSLVFVEVRRRTRHDYGGAAVSITREKRRRIVAAAAHYLVGLGLRTPPPSRFDVVTIDGDPAEGLRIAWIRDAFREDG